MVITQIRTQALEYAATCDAASERATSSIDRLTFHMLREVWKALACERTNLTDAEATTEFHNLVDIQQDVAKHLRPTLH